MNAEPFINTTKLAMREELRRKFPALARRCDAGSALAAIKLGCLECEEGTFAAVQACQDPGCPLYGFRLGHRPKQGPKHPTLTTGLSIRFQRKEEEQAQRTGGNP